MEENKETQKISANSLLDQIIAKTCKVKRTRIFGKIRLKQDR